jgi:hypothetical protein
MILKKRQSIMFCFAVLIGAAPAYANQTQTSFRCSNGTAFTLLSEGDVRDAFREDGMYLTLRLNGKSHSMISAQGADNTRIYGTDNDYSVIAWKSVSLLKGKRYIGEKCK